jgi:UDP-N-acetylenolpyruvoylglucosamine reductase
MQASSSKKFSLTSAQIAATLAPALGADRLRCDVPLAPYTTFRIGGPADVLYDATTADELATAVHAARVAGIPVFVLGLGANILVVPSTACVHLILHLGVYAEMIIMIIMEHDPFKRKFLLLFVIVSLEFHKVVTKFKNFRDIDCASHKRKEKHLHLRG